MSMMLRVTSVKMLHKTQNFASFDPKCWYNVRKIKNDNLPYVFSRVLHVRFCGVFKNIPQVIFLLFFPSSVFLHYINIFGQNLQNPVLISISTDHLNQLESRRYVTPGAGSWLRTVNVSTTCWVWHHDASNSSNGLPVISGSHATHWNNEKFLAEPRPQPWGRALTRPLRNLPLFSFLQYFLFLWFSSVSLQQSSNGTKVSMAKKAKFTRIRFLELQKLL